MIRVRALLTACVAGLVLFLGDAWADVDGTTATRFRERLVPPAPHAASAITDRTKAVVVSLSRQLASADAYTPGAALDLKVVLAKTGPEDVTVLGLEETLPQGWTFELSLIHI